MKSFIWKIKFIRLMRKRNCYFSIIELWQWSKWWMARERDITPEKAVRIYHGEYER